MTDQTFPSNFERCLKVTLRFEGTYTDNPFDPGGATNLGITLAVLEKHRGHRVSKDDVRHLTLAEASQIYHANYWLPIRGDELPASVALCLFDFGVNSGTSRAIKSLQGVIGVDQDGQMGPQTIAAARQMDAAKLVHALCLHRLAYMQSLRIFAKFGKGWTARVRGILATATDWAAAEHPHARVSTLMETDPVNDPTQFSDPVGLLSTVQLGQAGLSAVEAALNAPPTTAAEPDKKPFWASQTIWGGVGVVGAAASGAYLAFQKGDMGGFSTALTALLGGILAIVGRFKAVKPIG